MTELTKMTNWTSVSPSISKGWKFYVMLWLLANTIIWITTLVFLQSRTSRYTSSWTINVPASASNMSLSVPEIGQAYSSTDSPYKTFADPREVYKFLAESEDVLETAANSLNVPASKFSRPRIKIIDNTTLMKFEITGDTQTQAQKKAITFRKAFEDHIHKLRIKETVQQDSSLQIAVSRDKQKLQMAKQRLSRYKARSNLNSIQQMRDISTNLEGLRRQQAELTAQMKEKKAKVQMLSSNLGLSSQEASDALILQSDRLFQQYSAKYSQASIELIDLSTKYLPEHPLVIKQQQAKDAAASALIKQGELLLRRPVSQRTLREFFQHESIVSDSSSQRANLFQQLITLQNDYTGVQAQAKELEKQIAQLSSRMKVLSQQESTLDNLQRDVKIAEAVFSSNLTRLNLIKSNLSNSYPEVSIIAKSNLPKETNNPNPEFVIFGTTLCSLFFTASIGNLGLRDSKRKKAKSMEYELYKNADINPQENHNNSYHQESI